MYFLLIHIPLFNNISLIHPPSNQNRMPSISGLHCFLISKFVIYKFSCILYFEKWLLKHQYKHTPLAMKMAIGAYLKENLYYLFVGRDYNFYIEYMLLKNFPQAIILIAAILSYARASTWCKTDKMTDDHDDGIGIRDLAVSSYPTYNNYAVGLKVDNSIILLSDSLNKLDTYSSGLTPLAVIFDNDSPNIYVGHSDGSIATLVYDSSSLSAGGSFSSGLTKVVEIDANPDFSNFLTCGGDTFQVWSSDWSTSISTTVTGS